MDICCEGYLGGNNEGLVLTRLKGIIKLKELPKRKKKWAAGLVGFVKSAPSFVGRPWRETIWVVR